MKEDIKKPDEQIDRLEKQIKILKKRNSILKKCNDNLTISNRDLNTQLRAENRINERLKDILFSDSRGIMDYCSLRVFMRWVNEIILDNEKLNEKKKNSQPFKMLETLRVKLMLSVN